MTKIRYTQIYFCPNLQYLCVLITEPKIVERKLKFLLIKKIQNDVRITIS